eukprot:1154555-Pelagomonas_calceolata.AAC.1
MKRTSVVLAILGHNWALKALLAANLDSCGLGHPGPFWAIRTLPPALQCERLEQVQPCAVRQLANFLQLVELSQPLYCKVVRKNEGFMLVIRPHAK